MLRSFGVFLAALSVLIVAGCDRSQDPPPAALQPRPDGPTLLIGLIPEQNIFKQMDRYEPLAAYLSKKTGFTVRLIILPRYGNIIANFVSSKMDGAFFGSFTYALAHEKLGVEVLARPVNLQGASTYHGLLFVRRDSGITSIEDMRGKRFAFVDKATTAGYLLPLAYFTKHGVQYKTYLKESYFTGTHEDAIYDVLNGAAKNTIFDRVASTDDRVRKGLVVLERSPDVPENGLAVRKSLDEGVKKLLRDALVTMHADPEGKRILADFGARQFIVTTDADYRPVYEYARAVNLNLATYDYRNE
jgi:phosphonate transport system substrate-binding protein